MPWRPRAESKSGIGTCWVCADTLPRQFLNEHHRTPRAAAGTDAEANKVFICPTCHTACHEITKVFLKGKGGQVRDMIGLLVQDDKAAGDRMMELVKVEAQAWRSGERSEFQRVTFNLQRGVYDALKGIASATRNPNTQRPMGVGFLMETILTKWVETYMRARSGASPTDKAEPSKKRERPDLVLDSKHTPGQSDPN
jgi:hypothetical protein